MITTRILLASVLKPINDTRLFEKLGLSLSKLTETEVHICGFQAPIPVATKAITFHPIFSFHRVSFRRFLAPLYFVRLLFCLKPHLLLISTPELLLVSLLYKCFRKSTLVYDIQENYYLNITTQSVYPPLIKTLLANVTRFIEKLAAPYIHTFLLAEKSYAIELPFLKNRYLILENKFKRTTYVDYSRNIPLKECGPNDKIQLLYSGTISELYGIFEAIQVATKLHETDARFSLTIIGYCPQAEVLTRVKAAIQNKSFISLIGGSELVPHAQIITAIRQSQVGLLPYHQHPSLWRCVPTKLFEYIALGLPVLVAANPYWQNLIQTHRAGILIDFQDVQPVEIIPELLSGSFYPAAAKPDVFWESEEAKLLNWFSSTYLRTQT